MEGFLIISVVSGLLDDTAAAARGAGLEEGEEGDVDFCRRGVVVVVEEDVAACWAAAAAATQQGRAGRQQLGCEHILAPFCLSRGNIQKSGKHEIQI